MSSRLKKKSYYYDKWSAFVLKMGRRNDCRSSGCCWVSAIISWSRCGETSGVAWRWEWLTHRYAEGHHRARPQVSHFHPEKMKTDVSYPLVVRLMYQWGNSSDKIFRHLFRQITISPSKENLFWAKDRVAAAMCNSCVPGVCSSLGLSIMAVLGLVLNASLVVNNYLTSWQTPQTVSCVFTTSPDVEMQTRGFHGMTTWACFHLIHCKFGHQLQQKWEMNPTCSPGFLSDTIVF